MNNKDKIVVITGGNKGIGLATAKLYAHKKSKIVIIARNQPDLDKAKQEINNLGAEVLAICCDVSDLNQVKVATKQILDHFGRIDVLINNAAILNEADFLDLKPEDWQKEVDINLKGVLNCTYEMAPIMVEQHDGVIVNISSQVGKIGYAYISVYVATKFAILGFTKSFAPEVVNKGVRVYAVCPGGTATQMNDFAGMAPEEVGQRIVDVAEEKLNLRPGEDSEIFYPIVPPKSSR